MLHLKRKPHFKGNHIMITSVYNFTWICKKVPLLKSQELHNTLISKKCVTYCLFFFLNPLECIQWESRTIACLVNFDISLNFPCWRSLNVCNYNSHSQSIHGPLISQSGAGEDENSQDPVKRSKHL